MNFIHIRKRFHMNFEKFSFMIKINTINVVFKILFKLHRLNLIFKFINKNFKNKLIEHYLT